MWVWGTRLTWLTLGAMKGAWKTGLQRSRRTSPASSSLVQPCKINVNVLVQVVQPWVQTSSAKIWTFAWPYLGSRWTQFSISFFAFSFAVKYLNCYRIHNNLFVIVFQTRIQTAIDKKACNCLLLKVNQIGSVTESIQA